MACFRMGVDLTKAPIGKSDGCSQHWIAIVKQVKPRANIWNLNGTWEKAIAREVIVDLRSESKVNATLQQGRSRGVVSKKIVTDQRSQAMGRDHVEARLSIRGRQRCSQSFAQSPPQSVFNREL